MIGMKKFILLFILVLFTVQTAHSVTGSERRQAFKTMQRNDSDFFQKCSKLAGNFRYDQRFYLYLSGSCMETESRRKRLLDAIYPSKLDNYPNYSENYYKYRTNFSSKYNEQKFKEYKPIIDEYCNFRTTHSVTAKRACEKAKTLF